MSEKELQKFGAITDRMQSRGELPKHPSAQPPGSKPASNGSSSKPTAPAEKEKLDPKWLATVWQAFGDWFGSRWTSNFGPDPLPTWAYGLAGLTGAQVRYGLDHVRTSGREWPPSCPEFRALCSASGYDASDGASIAGKMHASRALPVPPDVQAARKAQAAKAIAQCRRILGR